MSIDLELSAAAIGAYEQHGDALVDRVNRALARSPDCARLIGGNPVEVMYGNHRNHHGTLLSVMRLGAWSVLEQTAPWVYATYLAHGFAADYFPALFAAFREALDAELDPAHAAELRRVYDWLEARHDDHLRAGSARTAPVAQPAGAWELRVPELVELMIRGDSGGVIQLAEQHIGSPPQLIAFYLQALCPALHEVGARWERGRLSVAHEHLASGVANRVMAHFYHHVLDVRPTRGKAVVTAGPNEFHAIGPMMLADALAVDGWQAIQLGANTPADDLMVLLREYQPDLLAVAVTMPFNLLAAGEAIGRARQLVGARPCHVLVGGQAFCAAPGLWRELGADSHAATIAEAVEQAGALWGGRAP